MQKRGSEPWRVADQSTSMDIGIDALPTLAVERFRGGARHPRMPSLETEVVDGDHVKSRSPVAGQRPGRESLCSMGSRSGTRQVVDKVSRLPAQDHLRAIRITRPKRRPSALAGPELRKGVAGRVGLGGFGWADSG